MNDAVAHWQPKVGAPPENGAETGKGPPHSRRPFFVLVAISLAGDAMCFVAEWHCAQVIVTIGGSSSPEKRQCEAELGGRLRWVSGGVPFHQFSVGSGKHVGPGAMPCGHDLGKETMMGPGHFTDDFKRDAVAQITERGYPVAEVTENTYDSPTGRILLVPQGTRVIGQYDNNVQFGQSRVLLVWNRLIFPNGRSIVLERQPGADAEGYAGLQDGVDYHWWDLAKAAGLSTLLSIGAELATNDDDRLIQAIRNGGQDTINDAAQHRADPHDPPRLSGP
eukprot:gene41806-51814_t